MFSKSVWRPSRDSRRRDDRVCGVSANSVASMLEPSYQVNIFACGPRAKPTDTPVLPRIEPRFGAVDVVVVVVDP